ncbi:hypothetical protein [Pseudonocardia sp. D17]|uniref:hypothetical protein n=1 Tax=Pseudonocardia sp. D17 TaxID=882661 RepID=UPI002B3D9D41|nr:hypothetical protein PSD17_55450 [Pseudonocardia sp. D17]
MRYPDTVVRCRPGGVDRFGDPGTETRTEMTGAFAPVSSSEDHVTRGDTTTSTATLYLPYGSDVVATDVIEIGGRRWHVDGDPAQWSSPLTGRRAVCSVSLRAVSG